MVFKVVTADEDKIAVKYTLDGVEVTKDFKYTVLGFLFSSETD